MSKHTNLNFLYQTHIKCQECLEETITSLNKDNEREKKPLDRLYLLMFYSIFLCIYIFNEALQSIFVILKVNDDVIWHFPFSAL